MSNFAFNQNPTANNYTFHHILDFDLAEGDAIDIKFFENALVSNGQYDPNTDTLNDFVNILDDGTDTFVQVDYDGAGNFADLLQVFGFTGHGLTLDCGILQNLFIRVVG